MANELEITKYEKRVLFQELSKNVIEWLTEEKTNYILTRETEHKASLVILLSYLFTSRF